MPQVNFGEGKDKDSMPSSGKVPHMQSTACLHVRLCRPQRGLGREAHDHTRPSQAYQPKGRVIYAAT